MSRAKPKNQVKRDKQGKIIEDFVHGKHISEIVKESGFGDTTCYTYFQKYLGPKFNVKIKKVLSSWETTQWD